VLELTVLLADSGGTDGMLLASTGGTDCVVSWQWWNWLCC